MLFINSSGNRIHLSGDTYQYKDFIKAMPGRHWEVESKCWSFPRTASTYMMLTSAFPGVVVRDLDDLERVTALLKASQEAKTADWLVEPASMTHSWDHQKRAFWFAYNRLLAQGGAMLALDMGTGKSKVAIDLINALNCHRVLIVCPTSVLDVWPEQFEVHSCRPWTVHVCSNSRSIEQRAKEASKVLAGAGDVVVVVNSEAVWRKPFESVANSNWDMVIADEIHRAKTPGGKYSRFLSRLGSTVPYRLGLTGTPCPHSIDDMYAQARFIDPSVWGTNHQVYKSQYIITGGFGNYQVLGFKNTDDWNEKFHGLAIQVKASDCLDLPEAVHIERHTELDANERSAYDDMKALTIAQVKDGTITAANALVKLLRLAQIVQGTVTTDMDTQVTVGTSKADLLRDVLEDLDEPVVVFCRFKCDLANIKSVVESLGRSAYELSGNRNQLAEWKEACKERPAVIGVQIQAGGVGISMVQARYCIYMSKDFNLGNYEQSLARVHRPGQNHKVTYIHLVAKGTIDETINRALAKRKDCVEEILAEMEA